MAERDLQKELEILREEMAKLRADFSGVAAALKGAGRAEADILKDSTADIAESVKEHIVRALENAKSKGKHSVEVVETKVAEHPFVSLLAAFGIGFLVGKLLDRK